MPDRPSGIADVFEENWSGREDLNLRLLGPEPRGDARFSEGCSSFSLSGRNWVVTSDRPRTEHRPPSPTWITGARRGHECGPGATNERGRSRSRRAGGETAVRRIPQRDSLACVSDID